MESKEKRAHGKRPPPRRRGKILLLLFGIALALAALEIVLRTLSPLTLGFEYLNGEFTTPKEFDRDSFRNSLGFHDKEPRPQRADGSRVLLLGDSYVAALSVPVPKIVGNRLQFHLNRISNQVRKYDVVSIGREDWGPAEELNALARFGPSLKPDLVVTLFLSLNDIRNSSAVLQDRIKRRL